MSDGSLLRGEVLARWQEFVGTGEFFRQVETTVSRVRDRIVAGFKGEPVPSAHLDEALHSGVAELIRAEGQGAATTTSRSWRSLAGGSTLLQAHPDLTRASAEFDRAVSSLVHDWQGDVLDLVRSEGKDRRTTAKVTAYGVNAVGTVLMLVTFAYTGGITGAEVGIAGGTAVLGQKLLEAIFGDQAVRSMAAKAQEALLDRAEAAFAQERERFTAVLDQVDLRADQARTLGAAAAGRRQGVAVSPLLKGRAKIAVATQEIVRAQAEALDVALVAGGDQLDADDVAAARQIIAKVGQRNALAGDHTVIALAGATGSGKSSLFNALAGQELARSGPPVRPPRHRRRRSGGTTWPGHCSTGSRSPVGTGCSARVRSEPAGEPAGLTRRPGTARPARLRLPGERLTGRRPSACWRSATCSSG